MRRFLAGCLLLLLVGCGDILGCVESPSTPITSFALIRGACFTVYRTKQ